MRPFLKNTRARSISFPAFDSSDKSYNKNVVKSPDREDFDSLMSCGKIMQIIFSCETKSPFIDLADLQKICGTDVISNANGITQFEAMIADYRNQICNNNTSNPIPGLAEFCQRINEVCSDADKVPNTICSHHRKKLKFSDADSLQETEGHIRCEKT